MHLHVRILRCKIASSPVKFKCLPFACVFYITLIVSDYEIDRVNTPYMVLIVPIKAELKSIK
jgi:hypothetical protein